MKTRLLTALATVAALFAIQASAETVEIANAADWAAFANRVNNGETTLGAKLTADVTLTQDSPRVGDADGHPYGGTFDGDGHKLTLNWNLSDVEHLAPFAYVSGATISALHTAGAIATDRQFASGLIGQVLSNGATIKQCRSSVEISNSISGDATSAGFIGRTCWVSQNVKIEDCLFDGSLLCTNGTHIGGFAGFNFDATDLSVNFSVFAPKAVVVSTQSGSSTFSRHNSESVEINTCYYTLALGETQGEPVSSMIPEQLISKLGANWKVSDGTVIPKVFASSGSGSGGTDPDPDPSTDPDPESAAAAQIAVTYVSSGVTLGTSTAGAPLVALRNGSSRFLGYFTEATGGTQIFDEKYALVEGALDGLASGTTLYAHWAPGETALSGIVYRGQLNLLSGGPAASEDGTAYVKRMFFRVYDGEESVRPLWASEPVDVTVNADGSFVQAFGDETLASMIATGRVSHVGVSLGDNADTAIELKPRRALRSVAAVNRALVAEGASPDIRIGNLLSDNALAVNSATVSHLEVSGTVNAPAEKMEVAPLTVGAGERTRILRGGGVSVFADENPTVLKENSGAVAKGALLVSNVSSDGIALISSCAAGERTLRCPAVVQFCRKGENIYAPTSDDGGLKVTFFPFIGKEGN